ncbi:uncharacterized protein N7503_007754 [Penicillium pulvis]|uniref:uncharacterized protein n=1 Tax=Penicillium pulvis TaxID=1562058 RepID=UPI002546DA14|nr:uncharacterized protein N7503_007754 [Penicillium pulvis]KAJ5798458.1 hypothetical protein N7503_007754 [Penicillium pulvis]
MSHDQNRGYSETPNDPPAMPITTWQERETLSFDAALCELPVDEVLRDFPLDIAVLDLSLDLTNASTSSLSQRTYSNIGYTPTPYIYPTTFDTGFAIQEAILASNLLSSFDSRFTATEPIPKSTHPTTFGSSSTTRVPTLEDIYHTRIKGMPQSHQINAPNYADPIRCEWQGCTYKGTFGRRSDLNRHTKSIHISPRAFKCPECGRDFNRKENLQGHLENVHEVPRVRR